MNIWDSVQRGLEKATQEATRIAKAQRLRATLESLTKQIEAQQGDITTKAMELFKNGQLTQSELLILCQELSNTQQQFIQAQSELKQIQQSQNNAGATTAVYTQQSFQPYDSSQPSLVPPPPPGVEMPEISSKETIRAEIPPPPPGVSEIKHCTNCFAVLIPGNAFCHNCGTPVRTDISYQPTVRSSDEVAIHLYSEQTVLDSEGQATVRANDDEQPSQEKDGES